MQQHFVKDEELRPFELTRIQTCRECEHYTMFICKQCGCLMPVKVRIKSSACPIGKWSPEQ